MFQHAAAAYAATARLVLSGPELDAQVLIGSAGRLQRLLDQWPPTRSELDAALDHAGRVWAVIVGDALEAPGDSDPDLARAVAAVGRDVFERIDRIGRTGSLADVVALVRLARLLAGRLRGEHEQPDDEPEPEPNNNAKPRVARRICK